MKWLNTYNNILFATLGTLAIVVLIFAAITSIILFIGNAAENRGFIQDPIEEEEGLEKNEEGNMEYFLGDPELIDSSFSIYKIPVYKPEENDSYGKYSSSSYRSGLSVNLIIHDIEKNVAKQLFNHLVLISYSEILKANGKIYIEVAYADEDTNNNGIIDYDDDKSIALYDTHSNTINSIPLNNRINSISSQHDKNLNSLIIVGAYYKDDEQPIYHFYRYDLTSQKVFELENPM
jgi:hypothetical protein